MKKIVTLALAAAFVLALAGGAGAASFKIVVNKDNPARGLQRNKIGLMFMKMTAKWDSGAAVEPVDLRKDSPVRAAFSVEIHNRDVDAIAQVWQRAIFSGRGEPPPEKATDEEVISFVAGHPGGIGYVSAAAATDKVKVLDVLK